MLQRITLGPKCSVTQSGRILPPLGAAASFGAKASCRATSITAIRSGNAPVTRSLKPRGSGFGVTRATGRIAAVPPFAASATSCGGHVFLRPGSVITASGNHTLGRSFWWRSRLRHDFWRSIGG
jgi:hypothetical protein